MNSIHLVSQIGRDQIASIGPRNDPFALHQNIVITNHFPRIAASDLAIGQRIPRREVSEVEFAIVQQGRRVKPIQNAFHLAEFVYQFVERHVVQSKIHEHDRGVDIAAHDRVYRV